MKQFTLTKNEQEIMNLMWEIGRPLSRSEIIELSPDRSWKASSIHILLNQMLDKGAIVVDGFVKTGKNYGRTFSAAVSQEKYQVMQFMQNSQYAQSKADAISNFIGCLLEDDEIADEILDQIGEMIQKRKDKRAHHDEPH